MLLVSRQQIDLVTVAGEDDEDGVEIVNLLGDFEIEREDENYLYGDFVADTAIYTSPELNGELNGFSLGRGFRIRGLRMARIRAPRIRAPRIRASLNTRGLTRGLTRGVSSLTRGASQFGRSVTRGANQFVKAHTDALKSAGRAVSNIARGAGNLLSQGQGQGQEQPEEDEQNQPEEIEESQTQDETTSEENTETPPGDNVDEPITQPDYENQETENAEVNGLFDTLGAAAGTYFGGPAGTAIGSQLGNIVGNLASQNKRYGNTIKRINAIIPDKRAARKKNKKQQTRYAVTKQSDGKIKVKAVAPNFRSGEPTPEGSPGKSNNTILIVGGVAAVSAIVGVVIFSNSKKGKR